MIPFNKEAVARYVQAINSLRDITDLMFAVERGSLSVGQLNALLSEEPAITGITEVRPLPNNLGFEYVCDNGRSIHVTSVMDEIMITTPGGDHQ